MPRPIYYKYRSLENFEFFVDILVNQQLYATTYPKMNDAMEGIYYASGLKPDILKNIRTYKEKFNICSLSKKQDELLLWAHYANGSRGVNIGVEVTGHYLDIRDIEYGDLPTINSCISPSTTAKEILTHKHESWRYEGEVRIFTQIEKPYIKVLVKEIILGKKITSQHKRLVTELASKLVPDARIIEYKDLPSAIL